MANSNGGLLVSLGAAFMALPKWGQVLAIMGTIGGTGAGIYSVSHEYRELPARVAAVEDASRERTQTIGHELSLLSLRVEALTDTLHVLSTRVDRIICLQEAAAGQHGYEQCAR